ncbi:hypothetical protein FYC62_09595 [Pedobacter aquae]|uniref:Uncharacterized protein n=1 Tax=Pedobacter aquae TaxID=2605747 RepID=A0A5C0VJK2_9SPHI|nr:hypothetical protein [Pedobacter aquae]QEK51871.1 hypothetical protein FYC62_09595 [Pedobacter aquae]
MENKKESHPNDEQFNRNQESNLVDNEAQNLKYNPKEDSFELDVDPEEAKELGYDHPDPYDTAADDFDSDYDESNPYVGDEYDKNASLEHDADKLGMHITGEENLKISKKDEEIARTPEDDRDDLDEEGYPKFLK